MSYEWMTETSAGHWDFVIQENLTAKEAVAFMKSSMRPRTFLDNLQDFYTGEDLEKCLLDGLCHYGGGNRKSIRRKVNNWMQNRNLPSDREDLLCICFLLGLDENASDCLLKRISGQGIHYRNSRELVYAYCLKNNMDYGQAKKLADEIQKPDGTEGNGTLMADAEYGQKELLTSEVKSDFQALCNYEELIPFILERKAGLGECHNTAYQYFNEMFELLAKETGKKGYSTDEVVNTYLRLNMPFDRHTSGYSCLQKLIKKHWPGSRSVKAMKSRKQDVSRKVLLLLYIVTGGIYHDSYEEMDEEGISAEEFLEFHCRNMNKMLYECGMGRIDPRNAFDFLILYSIRPEKEIFMGDRMEEIIQELYRDIYY